MRIEEKNGVFRIYVSRRNLNTLIAKLDGFPPSSACTIAAPSMYTPPFYITAEEDDVHYSHPSRQGEEAGVMHPHTEVKLLLDEGVDAMFIELKEDIDNPKGPIGGTDANSGDAPEKTEEGTN